MDNLTHTLFAATLARTPLGRAGRGTASALFLASNAPDIDIIATSGGALRYLEWHRGPTHGPLGIVGLGLVTAGLVWAGRRALDRRRAAEHASYRSLAAVAVTGVLLHVLMDLPTSYGTRLLSPFDWHWYGIDVMPIVDLYLLFALSLGLALGLGSEAARRRSATIVLAFMAANYALRGAAHERALGLAPRVFGALPEQCDPVPPPGPIARWPRRPSPPPAAGEGRRCLVEIAALPTFRTPFTWRLIAHLSDGYEIRSVNVVDRFGAAAETLTAVQEGAERVPNQWTPAVFVAARTEVGQRFLGFSRFPAARASVDPDGATTVRWSETRFIGAPALPGQRDRRLRLFTATVRVGADGRILERRLGP